MEIFLALILQPWESQNLPTPFGLAKKWCTEMATAWVWPITTSGWHGSICLWDWEVSQLHLELDSPRWSVDFCYSFWGMFSVLLDCLLLIEKMAANRRGLCRHGTISAKREPHVSWCLSPSSAHLTLAFVLGSMGFWVPLMHEIRCPH